MCCGHWKEHPSGCICVHLNVLTDNVLGVMKSALSLTASRKSMESIRTSKSGGNQNLPQRNQVFCLTALV